MNKALIVAWREFVATVATKGFIIGVFLPPVMISIILFLLPKLMPHEAPKVEGHVAVIDLSGGGIAERLKASFAPEAVAESMMEEFARDNSLNPEVAKQAQRAGAGMGPAPEVKLKILAPGTDPAAEQKAMQEAPEDVKGGSAETRLALVIVPAGISDKPPVNPTTGKPEGPTVRIIHTPKLDIRWIDHIRKSVSNAVIDERLEAQHMNSKDVRAFFTPPKVELTDARGAKTNEVMKLLLPGAFMFLLWISVFTSGQYLLTSTIEEKSSRVMEVILSAASPMQLLSGKIMGQACVGLLILGAYATAGIFGLVTFPGAGGLALIDKANLVYLVIYFLIAFASIACLFAAVGSAVSDIREAQSLIGPVMIVVMIPMMLWLPILRNPNSTFAQVCSFVPPISPFIMVLRLAGSEPVPVWQIPASIALGVCTVLALAWMAAKIFRIGVLLYGKPPNFRTLIRWVRMA